MNNYFKQINFKTKDLIFYGVALFCLPPLISSPIALVLGFILVSINCIPSAINCGFLTKKLLAYSIVGLGFGINLEQAISASLDGIGLILESILSTLIIGWYLTNALKIEQKTGHLIASGTAICGGRAIAAVAPAIKADDHQTSIALATVFILNSIAHFVPQFNETYQLIFQASKLLLVLCLFLIGAGITFKKRKEAGMKSMILG